MAGRVRVTGGDFEDVGMFHAKFNVRHSEAGQAPMMLTDEERDFRVRFMIEELGEYCEAMGLTLVADVVEGRHPLRRDLPKAADALVDLSYVTLGTAHLHRLPWNEVWDEVQRANITKERCGINHFFRACGPNGADGPTCGVAAHDHGACLQCGASLAKHSLRGSAMDVIKPEGWTAPDVGWVLVRNGWDHADPELNPHVAREDREEGSEP